ncbi:lysoplasmalogenase [Sphingomonas sp. AX6]|uniref:lysoplasmalogenase n=1 Tax=Sphingomonas sp. AX6 TaxID=2653171 RepID=UPI0012F40283|nr:lysoplasmalogenase [Sphingomonas sp. AX6]VXC96963.1 Lysoplasmalogenase [Sphingomonas sp. AX6]
MRAIWWAALIAGISYFIAGKVGLQGPAMVAWKGAGVGLLAIWAATKAENTDGWVIALVLALGALGDVLLEVAGLTVGGIAFLAGHVVAIILYLGNRRRKPTASQSLLGGALLVATPAISWMVTRDCGVAVYALAIGAMAAAAWTSRFPRYRTGLGAVMFVTSDLLIFARMGPLEASPLPGLLIWPLYFGGQALIAHGVVQTLAVRRFGSIRPMQG